jgi:uncharacterized SAM-binding protein YcdF (DUF218 family)
MFFYLSKVLGFFATPSNVVIAVGIFGALLIRTRFAGAGARLMIASLLTLAVIGLSPVGNALIVPLEQRFPPWDDTRGAPDGIVVLGGSISADVSVARNSVALNESAERLTVIAELARRYPAARIIFCGGDNAMIFFEGSESQFAGRLLESFGVARERIVLEERSRNTVENATYSKDLANPKAGERWLLVTSAYHMPRAIGVFRQAGFPVDAFPADWRTRGPIDALRPFATLGDGLRRTDTAVREWVGLVAYWLTGQSSDLFPGPPAPAGCDRLGRADNCRR